MAAGSGNKGRLAKVQKNHSFTLTDGPTDGPLAVVDVEDKTKCQQRPHHTPGDC